MSKPLGEEAKKNFARLVNASTTHHLCLVQSHYNDTRKSAPTICVVEHDAHGTFTLTPIGVVFDKKIKQVAQPTLNAEKYLGKGA